MTLPQQHPVSCSSACLSPTSRPRLLSLYFLSVFFPRPVFHPLFFSSTFFFFSVPQHPSQQGFLLPGHFEGYTSIPLGHLCSLLLAGCTPTPSPRSIFFFSKRDTCACSCRHSYSALPLLLFGLYADVPLLLRIRETAGGAKKPNSSSDMRTSCTAVCSLPTSPQVCVFPVFCSLSDLSSSGAVFPRPTSVFLSWSALLRSHPAAALPFSGRLV